MRAAVGRYRKKPVEIEAAQFDGTVDGAAAIMEWIWASGGIARFGYRFEDDVSVMIDTLEGTMEARTHDWVIRGVAGEFYPCRPDIFTQTYDPAEVKS